VSTKAELVWGPIVHPQGVSVFAGHHRVYPLDAAEKLIVDIRQISLILIASTE
jgi:hypothetical protein